MATIRAANRHPLRRVFPLRRMIIVLLAAALAFAACGGDDDSDEGGSGDTTTPTTGGDSGGGGELGTGVTEDSIKVGIALVDYASIADFVDFTRGNQEETAQIFVDYINQNGGVGGRMIEPVFKSYPPIPGQEPSALSLCTAWTEDDQVFAVLGVFIDFTGDAQLCLARDHNTVHIGHELEQAWIDEAPGGLMVTPDTTKEAAATILINLLAEEQMLEGKKVAVLADNDAEGRANDVIVPALEEADVDLGPTAILTISGTDTSAPQAQFDGFIERWKSEDVDTVFIAGLVVSAKQWVEKLKAEMPDVQLITDASSTAAQGQDLVQAGVTPNPYEGMWGTEGETGSQRWANKSALLQECVDVYEDATGTTVIGPDDVVAGPDGKTEELYIAVTDFCNELFMFKQIAEDVGADLNAENWQATVDDFGPIDLASTSIASLCEGKYAADDAFRIVEFDTSIGESGDWSPVTDVVDASDGQCS